MENPYKIELVTEKDFFAGTDLPYYYVYDLNGNFIERFFYGDSTKPGFGENDWIYTDNNAYNFQQIKETVNNSFDPIAKEKFAKAVSIMNETGLPYHLALTLIKPDKKEIEIIDLPIANIPVNDTPLINPLPSDETPVFALPLPPEEEEIIFSPVSTPNNEPDLEIPLINVHPDPNEQPIPIYEETERNSETPGTPTTPGAPIPDMPVLTEPEKDLKKENKSLIVGLAILLFLGLMSD